MTDRTDLQTELAKLKARVAEIEAETTRAQPLSVKNEISTSTWQAIVAASPMFVTLVDQECRILYINRVTQSYTLAEVIGSSVLDWMPPECQEEFRSAVQSIFRDGKPIYFEGVDSRGGKRWGNHLGPVFQDGKVIAVNDISEDITDRVRNEIRLSENEARLRFLVASMPVVCWTIDHKFIITSSHGAGLKGLGLHQDEVVGMSLQTYFGESEVAKISIEHHRQALNGETIISEGAFAGRNYQTMITPLCDESGTVMGAIGVSVDITERCRQEAEVMKARDELEQHVRVRTEELNEANKSLRQERVVLQRLVDLHDRDRQLTAYEIHDGIVQDMTAALMFFEVGGASLENQTTHTAISYQQGMQVLRGAIQEARRIMNGISPDVLEQFGPIDAIASLVQEKQELSGIQFEFTHDVQFERLSPAIELAMFRIVQESLNNIWKHSGSPRAEVLIRQTGERLSIVIRDWGHGFDITKIAPKRYGLIGIRERARLTGGEAKIESQKDVGTTITVDLPLTDFLLQAEQGESAS